LPGTDTHDDALDDDALKFSDVARDRK